MKQDISDDDDDTEDGASNCDGDIDFDGSVIIYAAHKYVTSRHTKSHDIVNKDWITEDGFNLVTHSKHFFAF